MYIYAVYCKHCKGPITGRRDKEYCSNACRAKASYQRRKKPLQWAKILCRECNKPFAPVREWQVYCSDKCRHKGFYGYAPRANAR